MNPLRHCWYHKGWLLHAPARPYAIMTLTQYFCGFFACWRGCDRNQATRYKPKKQNVTNARISDLAPNFDSKMDHHHQVSADNSVDSIQTIEIFTKFLEIDDDKVCKPQVQLFDLWKSSASHPRTRMLEAIFLLEKLKLFSDSEPLICTSVQNMIIGAILSFILSTRTNRHTSFAKCFKYRKHGRWKRPATGDALAPPQ